VADRAEGEGRLLLRSAGAVSAAVFLSRITGLAREMTMAGLFGAGTVNDAFQLGFRLPNLTRDLFAEGALSSAFVPTFTQYLATKGKREAAELSDLVATSLFLVVAALCALGMLFAPQLVGWFAPGFAEVPGKRELAVLLTRIMFPFLALVALAAQAMGVLNACDRYGVPALSSAMFNIGSVTIGLALGHAAGPSCANGPIIGMACGVVAGGALQLLWQVPSLYRAGFAYRPRLDFAHPGLRRIGRLMLPAFLGNAAVQINVLVNTSFASGIADAAGRVIDGPVSWLSYAFRFMQLPLGLFGVALAAATLPAISRSAAIQRMEEFGATLSHSLGLALLLTIPSSVGLAVLGRGMIAAVYQRGRFTAFDTEQTARALACYSLGLAGYSAIKILAPAFYALGDARTPMLVSLASIAVNGAAAYVTVRWAGMGAAGLALSTSLVALGGAAALFAILRARLGGIRGARLFESAWKIAGAAGIMGVACRASSLAIPSMAGAGRLAQLAGVAVSIPFGALVFYAAGRALGIRELEAVRAACYTSFRNAPRPEAGDSPPGNR
jgi:putative peptidoglycan lipid II flippase